MLKVEKSWAEKSSKPSVRKAETEREKGGDEHTNVEKIQKEKERE